jgi:phospholipase/lecithinase/hemolysin
MRNAALILTLICAGFTGTAAAVPFSGMVVFGDSNSDTGRRLLLQGTKPASPPYFMGRHSNGPVAVEHLAASLGLTAPGEFVNYAVGGALSGHGNVDLDPLLGSTGLLDQFQTFNAANPSADPNALYFIYGGDNDINECNGATNDQCTTAQIHAVVANLETLVQDLQGIGARHFMVIGSYGGGADKNEFRTLLQSSMEALDALLDGDILYFSARPVLLEMTAAGNPYGFTHRSSAFPCYTGNLLGVGPAPCGDPETYVFWDPNGHLTARAHEILGAAMAAAVPAAPTLPLVLAGLLGMALAARRVRPG